MDPYLNHIDFIFRAPFNTSSRPGGGAMPSTVGSAQCCFSPNLVVAPTGDYDSMTDVCTRVYIIS